MISSNSYLVLLLLLGLLGVAIEVQVGHNVPSLLARQGATHAQDLAGQQPPNKTNRVHGLVVAGDGHIHIPMRRLPIIKGNKPLPLLQRTRTATVTNGTPGSRFSY